MIELVFLICLASDPENCKPLRPAFAPDYRNVMACLTDGMVRAAQWSENNNEWTIVRWRCEHAPV